MISKDVVFVISSNVDDSIRSASIYSDIKVFKTFSKFESYINTTPVEVSMIIVNSKDLQFTNNAMTRLVDVLESTFVSLSGYLYYMVDDKEVKDKFTELCNRNGYTKLKCVYSQTLHAKDVADVLSGESLSSKETVTEIHTYRVRAADYVRSQRDKEGLSYEGIYETDEDLLSGIPDEEIPEDLRSTESNKVSRCIVCGNRIRERCSWVLLKAQYLSLSGKTMIIERDTEYHTLFDMISKIGIEYDFYDIVDIFRDCYDVISRIKNSKSKLIFVGTKNKIDYNYDVLVNILVSNLEEDLDYYIYETVLSQIPYGDNVDVVIPTTVPEIFRSVNLMSSISEFNDIHFIGLDITSLGSVSISEKEFYSLLSYLFQDNSLHCSVASVNGLLLRKEIGLSGVFMHN